MEPQISSIINEFGLDSILIYNATSEKLAIFGETNLDSKELVKKILRNFTRKLEGENFDFSNYRGFIVTDDKHIFFNQSETFRDLLIIAITDKSDTSFFAVVLEIENLMRTS